MQVADIFNLYCEMHAGHQNLASLSSFMRVWRRWSSLLGIRPVTTHSVMVAKKCLLIATSKQVQAFRCDDAELPHIIMTIDAMDKAKWMVPRTLENTKRLAALWRPSLRVVGVLAPGILEYYAMLEGDVPKDSDAQQSLLAGHCLTGPVSLGQPTWMVVKAMAPKQRPRQKRRRKPRQKPRQRQERPSPQPSSITGAANAAMGRRAAQAAARPLRELE